MNFFKKLLLKRKYKGFIKNLSLLITIITFTILTIGFIYFGKEIKDFGVIAIEKFGMMGLFGMTIVMDTFIQPISPDVLVFSYTYADSPYWLTVFTGAIASVIAGIIGYFIGHLLEEEGIDKYVGKKRYKKAHKLFVKYGFFAILIGSISPIPFSAICWSAGIFRMPFRFFVISVITTRIPRFLVIGYLGSII